MAVRTISALGGNWNALGTWDEGAVPGASDDVVARGDGTSGNVVVNVSASCRSMDLTNYSGTLSGASALNIGTSSAPGSNIALKCSAGMTFSHTGTLTFVSTVSGLTITWAGKSRAGATTFNGVGGGWTLQDGWTQAAGTATVTAGALDLNGQTCTLLSFNCAGSGVRSVTFGAATVTTTGTAWTFSGSNLTLSAASSTVNFARTSTAQTFTPAASQTWGTINVTGSSDFVIATTATTITALNITPSAAITVTLPAGVTTTATTLAITGSSGNVVTVVSSTGGSAATLSVAGGTVVATYVSLQDNTAAGGATFTANHATIRTNVTGWVVVGTGTVTGVGALSSSGSVGAAGTGTFAAVGSLSSSGSKTGKGTGTISGVFSVEGVRLPPEDFTLVWVFTPDGAAAVDAGGQLTVMGRTADGDEQVAFTVDYDPSAFVLAIGDTTVTSPSQTFIAGTHVVLAVRISDAGAALSVKAGAAAMTHTRETAVTHAGVEALTELFFGVPAGAWGSGTWGSGVWGAISRPAGVVENLMGFEDALSDAELEHLAEAGHRLDNLPTPEARLVWYAPLEPHPIINGSPLATGRRYEATTEGGTGRNADDFGLTKALAVLDDGGGALDGLALYFEEAIDAAFAAILATTGTGDNLADHHDQFAAASTQETRVR